MVGCVITQQGEIVGEGFHPKAGEPHAEVFALRAAGTRAHGATVYVSLEPCNHYGRTPPCAEALIKAQVSRVVVGMVDPDPRVSGGGIARLREAGIEVIVGVEEAACRQLNEGFIQRVLHQRPFGILKYAMTLDGKIATPQGHSAWVSNEAARSQVHQLRSTCDAIIIGTHTVARDNPSLTSHCVSQDNCHNPLRVVMSRSLQLPVEAQIWDVTHAPTLVLTQGNGNPQILQQIQDQGVEVLPVDQLTPQVAMAELYRRGCATVLWECGGTLAAAAIAQGMVQKVMAFIAPKVIGGVGAPSPVGNLGFSRMSQALELNQVTCEAIGTNFLIQGYLEPPKSDEIPR